MVPIGFFPFIWLFLIFMGVIGFLQAFCGIGALVAALFEGSNGWNGIVRGWYWMTMREYNVRHRDRWARRWFGEAGAKRWKAMLDGKVNGEGLGHRTPDGGCRGYVDVTPPYQTLDMNGGSSCGNDTWTRIIAPPWGEDALPWRLVKDLPPRGCDWMAAGFWDKKEGVDGKIHDPTRGMRYKLVDGIPTLYSGKEYRDVSYAFALIQGKLQVHGRDYHPKDAWRAYGTGDRGSGGFSGLSELKARWRLQEGEFSRGRLARSGKTAVEVIEAWSKGEGWFCEDEEMGLEHERLYKKGKEKLHAYDVVLTDDYPCAPENEPDPVKRAANQETRRAFWVNFGDPFKKEMEIWHWNVGIAPSAAFMAYVGEEPWALGLGSLEHPWDRRVRLQQEQSRRDAPVAKAPWVTIPSFTLGDVCIWLFVGCMAWYFWNQCHKVPAVAVTEEVPVAKVAVPAEVPVVKPVDEWTCDRVAAGFAEDWGSGKDLSQYFDFSRVDKGMGRLASAVVVKPVGRPEFLRREVVKILSGESVDVRTYRFMASVSVPAKHPAPMECSVVVYVACDTCSVVGTDFNK